MFTVYTKYVVYQNVITAVLVLTAVTTCSSFILEKTGKLYIGRNPVSEHQIQLSMENEQADAGRDG